jgi:hypothetical protein
MAKDLPPLMKIGFFRQVRDLKIQRKKLSSALGDGEIRASPAVLLRSQNMPV